MRAPPRNALHPSELDREFRLRKPKLVSLGVDFITCTCTESAQRVLLQRSAERALLEQRERGNELVTWRGQGYHGWRCGSVITGERADSTFAQASGADTADLWEEFGSYASNVTRIDLQGTIELEADWPEMLGQLLQTARGHRPERGRPCRIDGFDGGDGGFTVYAGAPSSDTRVRVYDKGIESRSAPPGRTFRVEVQHRRGRARAAYDRLRQAPDRAAVCSGIVAGELANRTGTRLIRAGASTLIRDTPRAPDVSRKLAWLAAQVAPTVQWLTERGEREAAIAALGLAPRTESVR